MPAEWECRHCSHTNWLWRERCRECQTWYNGTEQVSTRPRSSSASRRERKAKNSKDAKDKEKDYDAIAARVAKLLGKGGGEASKEPDAKPTPSSSQGTKKQEEPQETATPEVAEKRKKIEKTIERNKAALAQLTGGEDVDPMDPAIVALKKKIEEAEKEKEHLKPVTTRIEDTTKQLQDLRAKKTVIEDKITQLVTEASLVDEDIEQARRRLDMLQQQHHAATAAAPKPTKANKDNISVQYELIKLAKQRGDKEMLTILGVPPEEAPKPETRAAPIKRVRHAGEAEVEPAGEDAENNGDAGNGASASGSHGRPGGHAAEVPPTIPINSDSEDEPVFRREPPPIQMS
eukprot:TRINITY_DN47430_c0_g1_i1.p2 TRINITY_DN47430_c0_g1~~TRINITY_DN47430_c0_g1_i1.p2  ORF type:complete len:346 (+),score=126.08 TRINITY_DN47430_c0_g1_i1:295-1332(+)